MTDMDRQYHAQPRSNQAGRRQPTSTPKQKRSREFHWLKQCISKYVLGEAREIDLDECNDRFILADDRKNHTRVIHLNTKAALAESFRHGKPWKRVSWTNEMFADHASGAATLYYTSGEQQGLICIDVDCHEYGNPADAMLLCQWLADNYFPGLYYEPSSNGNGAHAYLIVDFTNGGTAEPSPKVKRMLKEIGESLDKTAKLLGFDVELVEICGTPSFMIWRNGEFVRAEFGQLCKLPRGIKECQHTTQMTLTDLWETATEQEYTEDDTEAEKKKPRRQRLQEPRERKSRGSIQGCAITDPKVRSMMPQAKMLMDTGLIRAMCNKSLGVVTEDVAYYLACQAFFASNPFAPDGANPVARLRGLWDACYASGTFARAYHPSRAAAIRRALMRIGAVDLVSDWYRYIPGKPGKGIARRWSVDFSVIGAHQDQIRTLLRQTSSIPSAKYLEHQVTTGPTTTPAEKSRTANNTGGEQEITSCNGLGLFGGVMERSLRWNWSKTDAKDAAGERGNVIFQTENSEKPNGRRRFARSYQLTRSAFLACRT